MMDLNDRKERFSLAYISAVAAHAGYKVVEAGPPDKDSVDGILLSQSDRRPRIEFQAKATSRRLVTNTHLAYPLPLKNYDDLRANSIMPRLLIVVVLPDRETAWIAQNEKEL